MSQVEFRQEDKGGDLLNFVPAGMAAKGEFHCAACGYGVTVYRSLPRCPMCGGEEWEQSQAFALRRASSILN